MKGNWSKAKACAGPRAADKNCKIDANGNEWIIACPNDKLRKYEKDSEVGDTPVYKKDDVKPNQKCFDG